MRNIRFCVLFAFILCVLGCAAASAASVDEILSAPLGSGGLRLGMSKAQVIERYGEPDLKGSVTSDDWKEPREEWYYRGRFDILPINAGYLADDLYLYFDGDSLTNISHKPMGGKKEEEQNDIKGIIR